MKSLAIAIVIAILTTFSTPKAYALTENLKTALEQAEELPLTNFDKILFAIFEISEKQPAMQEHLSVKTIWELAEAISRVHTATGVDWKLILSISYVESRLCKGSLKGDKKRGRRGTRLSDYWATGCMQVHMRWWGPMVADAGLKQSDLLDWEKGMMVGAVIIDHLVKRYGIRTGIRKYNGSGPTAEAYRAKVLKVYNKIS